jgi:hypothetical protein
VSDGYLAGYLAGQDAERERIIKLLESLIVDSEGYFNVDEAIAELKGISLEEWLAMPKGENK